MLDKKGEEPLLSLLLLKKIASLFIILFIGVLIVRLKLLKAEDSKPLSAVVAYILNPCVLIASLQREQTVSVLKGLAFNIGAALLVTLVFIGTTRLLTKPLRLSPVERMSLIYPNVGNLIIPLVTSVLGEEYVVYTLGYFIVQHAFIWTHMVNGLNAGAPVQLKKLFLNPNILAIIAGLALFLAKIQLPGIVSDAISSLGDMLGPLAMLIIGMVIGGMDLKKTFSDKRVWLVALGRVVALPLIILLLFKYSGLKTLLPNGETLLLIVLLAAAAPSANMVTSLAQLYGEDAQRASAIGVVTQILCIATMPLTVLLYQL